MANAFVQVAPDSTGKKMQTFENTVSANVVEAEAVALVRSSDNTEIGTASQPVRVDPTGTTIQPDNIVQWSGTNVSAPAATAPVGTETAPIVRNIVTKRGQTLTTTPLGSGATFTSAWFDSNLDGAMFIIATAYSDHGNSTAATFQIQQADNTSINAFIITSASSSWPANTATTISCAIVRRYYRIVATNGATANTVQEIDMQTTTEITSPLVAADTSSAPHPILTTTNGVIALNWTTGIADQYGTGCGVPNILGATTVLPAGLWIQSGANGTGNWQAARWPFIFKTASVNATSTGNNAVWTPAAGKKFRLMRFQITAQGLAATATGVVTVSFQDSASGITIGTYDVDVPAVAGVVSGVNNISCGWIDLGNGILSTAANNVLNFNISAAGAGTVGTYRINVCGTEE